jgi:drug/metabolite transporter (DMT)-like permease
VSFKVIATWWVACLLWSSTFLFIRIGLSEIPPFTFAWIRLTLALAVLGPIAARRRSSTLTSLEIAHMCGSGLLLLGVNYALLFWGAQFVPSGLVAILQSGTPMLALVFAWLLGLERITPGKLAAIGAAIAGVFIIFRTEARVSGGAALAGAAAVFLGSACVALAYVWLKRATSAKHPFVIAAVQSAAAVVPLACIGLAIEGVPAFARWSPAAWGALLYLAACASVLAFSLNYWLLARMDASAMLLMGVAEVPIAIALGAIVLRERLPSNTLAGALLVLAGVTIVLRGRRVDGSRLVSMRTRR